MKKLATIFLLISFSIFAKEKPVEDSLIANIGKKAKVIFYAENKADFNEIAKYDLNKLFAEVRKRSEKNFSNNEEVTLREVDENLKKREVNTTVSPKKWFKNMNLNLFVGRNILGPQYISFIGNNRRIILPNSKIVSLGSGIYLQADGGAIFGIGGFYDRKIATNRRLKSSIRYGYGIDFMSPRVKANSYFNSYSSDTDPLTQNFRDSLRVLQEESQKHSAVINDIKRLPNTTVYFQFMPNFHIIDKKGQKTWNFGIGLKAGLNLNSFAGLLTGIFSDSRILKYPSSWGIMGTKSLSQNGGANLPAIMYQYRIMQTALTFNAGYKYVNFFYHLNTGNLIMRSFVRATDEKDGKPIPSSLQGVSQIVTNNTHSFGLRFGK